MDTRIYVVTHKQIQLPEHEGYVPMVVGNHSVSYQNGVHDNTGENIADKNGSYCELTALYWMWKNLPDEGRYGLCHYRRFFYNQLVDGKNTLDFDCFDRYFEKHDIILPPPSYWVGKTVKQEFIDRSISEYNFGLIEEAIASLYPEYLSAYHEVVDGYYASYCNMFVMSSKQMLDGYCQWLFDILFYIEQRVDLSNATDYEKRIYGFISERLLNVWVKKNGLRIKYLHIDDANSQRQRMKHLLDEIRIAGRWAYGSKGVFGSAVRKVYAWMWKYFRINRDV